MLPVSAGHDADLRRLRRERGPAARPHVPALRGPGRSELWCWLRQYLSEGRQRGESECGEWVGREVCFDHRLGWSRGCVFGGGLLNGAWTVRRSLE